MAFGKEVLWNVSACQKWECTVGYVRLWEIAEGAVAIDRVVQASESAALGRCCCLQGLGRPMDLG